MAKITEGNSKTFEAEISVEMDKVIKHFEQDLLTVRSGKASASMVEDISVESYGAWQKLKAVASISTPDARLILIQPWDKSLSGEIFKAVQNSDLGVTPVLDGALVRIQLPIMSTERREEMIKVVKKKTEDAKIKIRNVRREYNTSIKDSEKNKEISEDFSKRVYEHLQKLTDAFIEKIDLICRKKETDLKLI
jgi:ribosome recycling factor